MKRTISFIIIALMACSTFAQSLYIGSFYVTAENVSAAVACFLGEGSRKCEIAKIEGRSDGRNADGHIFGFHAERVAADVEHSGRVSLQRGARSDGEHGVACLLGRNIVELNILSGCYCKGHVDGSPCVGRLEGVADVVGNERH